jgi:hypothetical protein
MKIASTSLAAVALLIASASAVGTCNHGATYCGNALVEKYGSILKTSF